MIRIARPIVQQSAIEYPVSIGDRQYRFKVEVENATRPLNTNIDGIVCMLVPIAILNNMEIVSDEPIDVDLYDNLMQLPAIYKKYHCRHTLMSHIRVDDIALRLHVPRCARAKASGPSVTSLSLGVDSIYTVLKRSADVDTTVHIRGFDGPMESFAETNLEYASTVLKKPIQYIKTNIKRLMGKLPLKGTNYGVFTGDGIFVAAVYPLCPRTIIFNGFGCDNSDSFPCLSGQHPEINQYFKSGEFASENVDTARAKKIKHIVENTPLLNVLKVCTRMYEPVMMTRVTDGYGTYYEAVVNCSECGKCEKTLLYIWMLGLYKSAITFHLGKPDFLSHFENKYVRNPEYKRTRLLSSSFYDMIVDQVIALYKKNGGHLHNLEEFSFTFSD